MDDLLGLLFYALVVCFGCSVDIVRAEIEGPKDIQGDLAVEAKTLEADSVYDIAALVERADLRGEL